MSARVVALHGFLGCGNDWDAVRGASRSGLEWICPDLFARDAEPAEAQLAGLRGAWLAGYSFGARLALRWLTAEPGRWRGALLVSANPGNFLGDDERAARRAADLAWAEAFRHEPWHGLMERWNAQQVFGPAQPPVRNEKDLDRERLAAALEQDSVADAFTDAGRLEGEMTWLAGAEDAKFSALSERMRLGGFPGVFVIVPGAGHRLLHDAPAAVAAELDRLVARG